MTESIDYEALRQKWERYAARMREGDGNGSIVGAAYVIARGALVGAANIIARAACTDIPALLAENERLRASGYLLAEAVDTFRFAYTGDLGHVVIPDALAAMEDAARAWVIALDTEETDEGLDCLGPEGTCVDGHVPPCPLADKEGGGE